MAVDYCNKLKQSVNSKWATIQYTESESEYVVQFTSHNEWLNNEIACFMHNDNAY